MSASSYIFRCWKAESLSGKSIKDSSVSLQNIKPLLHHRHQDVFLPQQLKISFFLFKCVIFLLLYSLKATFKRSSSHFCFTVNRFLHHNQIQFNTPLRDLLMKELRGETSLSWAGTLLHNWIVRPACGGFIHFRERLSKGALFYECGNVNWEEASFPI